MGCCGGKTAQNMRTSTKQVLALVSLLVCSLLAIGLSGCASGSNLASTPAGLLYNTQTNYVPQVSVITNTVPITVYKTNEVPITVTTTNTQGVTAYVTNYQAVTVPVTSYVQTTQTVTNQEPNYVNTPKAGTSTAAQAVGGVVNTFAPGVGTMVGYGLAAVLGLVGYWTSSKNKAMASANYDTSAALAQEIQAVRSFLKSLPNGATMDQALTTWLNAHQNDAGVAEQVLTLLSNEVSNSSAQMAAQQIQQTIAGLIATNPSATATASTKTVTGSGVIPG